LGMRSGWSYARRFVAYQVIRRVRSYGVAVGLDLVAVTAAFETAVLLRFMDASDVGAALSSLLGPSLVAGGLYAVVSYLLGLHRRLWRFASLKDGFALMQAVAIATALVAILDLAGSASPLGVGTRLLPLSVVLGGGLLSFLFLGGVKIWPKVM